MFDTSAAILSEDLQVRADAGVALAPIAARLPRDFAEAMRLERPRVDAYVGFVWERHAEMLDAHREIAAEIEVEFSGNVEGDACESETEAAAAQQMEDAAAALVQAGDASPPQKMTAKLATDP
jgi:hypothetical protein